MFNSGASLGVALLSAVALLLSACSGAHRVAAKSEVEQIASPQAVITVRAEDATARLQGAEGVEKWEPSGVAVYEGALWVVSDKSGWLARYELPLSAVSQPTQVTQLSLPLDNRLKWEGLEVHPRGGLLMMEAISRSVWWCKDPQQRCSEMEQVRVGPVNEALNKLAQRAFYYLMFEALTVIEGQPWVGVRGVNAKPSAEHEGGLVPWISWARWAEGEPSIVGPKGAQESSFEREGRRYGLSGAVNDGSGGLWVTLSYEDEDGDSRGSVSGLLARLSLPLTPEQLTGPQAEAKVCAYFEMKPEGVTLTPEGLPLVVFDVDADRKGEGPERFALKRTEDYAWVAPESIKRCAR